MMRNIKPFVGRFLVGPFLVGVASALVVAVSAGYLTTSAQAQKPQGNAHAAAIQQPVYSDYKGVRIGMTTEEVRAKLGKPTLPADDQDYYLVSATETVQIVYDTSHKVSAISVDYLGGVGAPDSKTVVGPGVEAGPDGVTYKLLMYEKAGFWVSYHRSAGSDATVSITIQRLVNK